MAPANIAVIGGDGIGPEVTDQAAAVLQAALRAEGRPEARLTPYPLGAEHWLETGEALTDEVLESLRRHDAILFGAVGAAPGDERIPSGLIERGGRRECVSHRADWSATGNCGRPRHRHDLPCGQEGTPGRVADRGPLSRPRNGTDHLDGKRR